MEFKTRFRNWQRSQAVLDSERNRAVFLNTSPLPVNDPALTRPVKVKVLKPTFCIKGKRVQADSIITLPLHEAESLKAAGKIEFV